MDDKTFQAIKYLAEHPIETLFCGNLWPVAALLCKLADVEGLPISAAVRKIANMHPFKVDQNPNAIASEAAEAEYLQRRAKMIRKLTTEARNLYVYANEKKVLAQLPGYDPAKQGKGGKA